MGDMSTLVKIVVPPAKKKNLSWEGKAETSPPSPRHKYRKKFIVFDINITTGQQFFLSVSGSTKKMLKQRFPNFFPDHI